MGPENHGSLWSVRINQPKISSPAVKRGQPKPAQAGLGDWASDVHFLNESLFLISLSFLTGSLWSPWPKRRGKCQTLGAHAPKDLGVNMTIASLYNKLCSGVIP